jgi:hypothetical protein
MPFKIALLRLSGVATAARGPFSMCRYRPPYGWLDFKRVGVPRGLERSPRARPERATIRSKAHGAHSAASERGAARHRERPVQDGLWRRLGREGHIRWRSCQQDCTSPTSCSIANVGSRVAAPASAVRGTGPTGTPTGARAPSCGRDILAKSAQPTSPPRSSPAPRRAFKSLVWAHRRTTQKASSVSR